MRVTKNCSLIALEERKIERKKKYRGEGEKGWNDYKT
jgi:hypothetical protein